MVFIDWLAGLPPAMWQQAAPPVWSVLLALGGGIWLFLPRGFPARWLGLLAFLPLLTVLPPRPAAGAATINVLDVGQGLAIHVQTTGHDLLFDAGPAFSADADSGNRIIAPYLRAMGVRGLDALVVSHADKDHEGGAASVLAALPVAILKPAALRTCAASSRCHRIVPQRRCVELGRCTFRDAASRCRGAFARPTTSCVLRVTAAGQSMLLTSDIEAVSERALLRQHPAQLTAAVMTVPHHGSKTSSTPEFMASVAARDLVFPVGHPNRFGHPREDVVARYLQSGARLHRTDADGAVRIDLDAAGIGFRHERAERRRYWHAR